MIFRKKIQTCCFSPGPLQDSAVWIDESQTVYAQLGRGRTTSPLISKDDEDPLGISDEGNRAKSEDEMLKMFPDSKPEHDKTNKTSAPSKDLDQPRHSSSLINLRCSPEEDLGS